MDQYQFVNQIITKFTFASQCFMQIKNGNKPFISVGWQEIFYEMCVLIQEEIERSHPDREFLITQISCKFGELDIYTNGNLNDAIKKILNDAKEKSKKTCQFCGKHNGVQTNLFLKEAKQFTLCSDCMQIYKEAII